MLQWWVALAVLVGALALALTLGPGYAGYDAAWSLVWGHEIAAGILPSYEAPVAPTPHPLANVVVAFLSVLGDGEQAVVGLSFISFAAALGGAAVLGTRLAHWGAGLAAAIVLASRAVLDREAAFASVDLPFLALILWACAIEAGSERRPTPVLVLLLLAGLLRPEAWLLSVLYVAWVLRDPGRRARSRVLVPLAVAAPVLWAMSDLVATGNPLHSLTTTRDLAAELDRPTGAGTALQAVPHSLVDVMGTLPLLAGLLGLGAGLVILGRRMLLPVVVAGCAVATFVVLGLAGLPVLVRYLLVAACMLAVSAGVGLVLPWCAEGRSWTPRSLPAIVSLTIVVLLALSAPGTIDEVRAARAFTLERGAIHRDLRELASAAPFRAAAGRCPQIRVPDFRTRPVLLIDDLPRSARIVVGNLADGEQGLLVTYGSERARAVFNLGTQGEARRQAMPAGGRLVARNPSWLAVAVC